MGLGREFKEFAMKGSVLDLAIGVVIGGAFGKIVTSMVDDVLMPLVGLVTNTGEFFGNRFIELPYHADGNKYKSLDEARKAGVNVFAYGHFIHSIIDFVIIAFIIFLVIKFINKLHRKTPTPVVPEVPVISSTDQLLMEIRDGLKNR